MKIKLSKTQWEEIGNKTGWLKRAEMESSDIDAETGITKDQFKSYVRIQREGRYNMLMNAAHVMSILGVDKETYLDILTNYDRLLTKWPDVEE